MNNHKKILLVGIALAFLAELASSAQDKNVVYNEASVFPLYGKCVEETSACVLPSTFLMMAFPVSGS